MPKQINKRIIKQIEELLKEKKSQKEISELLNISDTTLRKIIRDNGWSRKNVLDENIKNEIIKLYCIQRESIQSISDKMHIPYNVVYKIINQTISKEKKNDDGWSAELDELNELNILKHKLLEKFENDSFIQSFINRCEIDILKDKAIEYCNSLEELVDEKIGIGENAEHKIMKVDRKNLNDIQKLTRYVRYRCEIINEIVKGKLMQMIQPILERHMNDVLAIPQPIFKGSLYYNIEDNGISKSKWRKSFNIDIFNDELGDIITAMNDSIRDGDNWSLDNYIVNKHPELCSDGRDLYEIEYQHVIPEIFIKTAGLNDICVVYDLLRTYKLITDDDHEALGLSDEERYIFDYYSNWKMVYVKGGGKMKLYKNYGKLNILKTMGEEAENMLQMGLKKQLEFQ